MQQQQALYFGPYRLELENEQLWQGKRRIRLTRKAWLVLHNLAEQPGQLVTKEALFEAVWTDSIVTDGALSRCIQELRKALGDTPKTPQYIETVHGRGFRFIAPIRNHAANSPSSTLQEQSSVLSLPDKPSIAVLPFTNMSNDPEQEHFSDGLTEDVITDLAQLSGLFVISRNSIFTYKGKAVQVHEVGRELGVRYVLEGSVRKADDRVRVTAQLVDTSTSGHVWAQRYDRDVREVFAVQDDITQQIVRALAIQLTAGEQARLAYEATDNLEAYEAFWRGEALVWRFTRKANSQARQWFERAIALDPAYAAAYASLGHTLVIAYELGWSHTSQTLERAFDLARQALTLDNFSVTARHALAFGAWEKGQHDRALADVEQAIALAPSNAYGYLCYGEVLIYAGRAEEGIRALEMAIRLDPHHPASYLHYLGEAYERGGRYEEALITQKRTLARAPYFWPSYIRLAILYTESNQHAEAQAAVAEVLKRNPHYTLEVLAERKVLYADPAVFERDFSALRRAGMP